MLRLAPVQRRRLVVNVAIVAAFATAFIVAPRVGPAGTIVVAALALLFVPAYVAVRLVRSPVRPPALAWVLLAATLAGYADLAVTLAVSHRVRTLDVALTMAIAWTLLVTQRAFVFRTRPRRSDA